MSMDDFLDQVAAIYDSDLISPEGWARLSAAIALLRPHAASPRDGSQSPPITGDDRGIAMLGHRKREDLIFVCGKCGTHYLDHY